MNPDITPHDRDLAYRLMGELLESIHDRRIEALTRFGVSRAILSEIDEALQGEADAPSLPPRSLAFTADGTGRIPFDLFDTEAGAGTRRIECRLWVGGKASASTMIADLSMQDGEPRLRFALVETQ